RARAGEFGPAGARPILRGELEVPVARPIGHDANDVREVALDVEPVQATRGDEREDVRRGLRVIVGAHEEPGLTAGGDRPELALAGIVVEAQPPVVEISPQRIALPDGVAERARDRTADPANALEDGLGPREKVVEHRARDALSPLVSLSRSKACPVLFELE